jgi:hypothetical protein
MSKNFWDLFPDVLPCNNLLCSLTWWNNQCARSSVESHLQEFGKVNALANNALERFLRSNFFFGGGSVLRSMCNLEEIDLRAYAKSSKCLSPRARVQHRNPKYRASGGLNG